MNCRDIPTYLYAYLDDALQPGLRQALQRHIDRCAACRGEVEVARGIEKDIRSAWRLESPPAGLWPRISRSLGRTVPGSANGKPVRRIAWTAAATVLLVMTHLQQFGN